MIGNLRCQASLDVQPLQKETGVLFKDGSLIKKKDFIKNRKNSNVEQFCFYFLLQDSQMEHGGKVFMH